jgi:hypothetical protein
VVEPLLGCTNGRPEIAEVFPPVDMGKRECTDRVEHAPRGSHVVESIAALRQTFGIALSDALAAAGTASNSSARRNEPSSRLDWVGIGTACTASMARRHAQA